MKTPAASALSGFLTGPGLNHSGQPAKDSVRPVADLLDVRSISAPGHAEHQQRGEEARVPSYSTPDDQPAEPFAEIVSRCLQDLLDDWERKGRRLAYDDVTRMATKRGLNGHELASVLEGLAQAGITPDGLLPGLAGSAEEPEAALDTVSKTGRDILGSYLQEIGRYRLLWAEDEVRLGRLITTGQEADAALADGSSANEEPAFAHLQEAREAGRRAHTELVLSNLRLVVSIARQSRYASSGLELIDRIQEGNLGLMHAADKYDYTLGYKFSTYATWWIRQSIDRAVANLGRLIRLPVYLHEKVFKVLSAQRRLAARSDRAPTLADLASAVQFDPGEVQAVLDWVHPIVSLDAPVGTDGDLTVGDLLSAQADVDGRTDPVKVMLNAARHRAIEDALSSVLDPRAAEVIRLRFGLGGRDEQTLEEIGRSLGVTRERIRQIAVKALKALANGLTSQSLYEFVADDTR